MKPLFYRYTLKKTSALQVNTYISTLYLIATKKHVN